MKKTFIFFLTTVIILSGINCKKSILKRHAKGIVTDITDGTPIPFASIAIQNEQTEFLGKTTYDQLATAECNGNGEFEVAYQTDRAGTNYVYAQAEHYFLIPETDKDEVNLNSRKKLEIKLTPKTNVWIQINITDTNIEYVDFAFYADSHNTDSYFATIGNTSQEFIVKGNRDNTYRYYIKYKNHTEVKMIGSLFCPKFDKPTAVLNINL